MRMQSTWWSELQAKKIAGELEVPVPRKTEDIVLPENNNAALSHEERQIDKYKKLSDKRVFKKELKACTSTN